MVKMVHPRRWAAAHGFAAQALAASALASALPFFLVIVRGINRERTEGVENSNLLALANIFFKRRCDRFLLGLVTSGASRLFDETVIQCEIRGHV
jgi:hypothetical protein